MFLLAFYIIHCTWVSQAAYSEPSIVLSTRSQAGRVNFDDFREAYYWLRSNTEPDAKIMSWWDYGYQIAAMANRTTLVDNNTWNNTHIATVGKMMASNESVAYPMLKAHDVDYILVVFGGMIGYSSDDINKFLWMVRISGSVDSDIKEADYMSPQTGRYAVDSTASKTMKRSLMYKMCYHGFGAAHGRPGGAGYDRARNVEVNSKSIRLRYLEEAYTTEHWMVRIYRVKHPENQVTHPKTRAAARRSFVAGRKAKKTTIRGKVAAAKGSTRVLSDSEKALLASMDAVKARLAVRNPFLAMTPADGSSALSTFRARKKGDASEQAAAKASAIKRQAVASAKAAKAHASSFRASTSFSKSNPVSPTRMQARKAQRQQQD